MTVVIAQPDVFLFLNFLIFRRPRYMTGKVKWFNAEKVMDLLKAKTAATYLFIFPQSNLRVSKLLKRVNLFNSM